MKRFKMMLVAVAAIFALMLGTEKASAQSGLSDNILTPPTANWVDSAEAVALMTQHIAQLKDLLVTLTPGTTVYGNVERSVFFYSTVQGEVDSGKDIPLSIVTGLEYIGQDVYGGATKAQMLALRNESIDMLGQ